MKQLTSSEKCVIHRPVKTEIQVKSCSLFYAGIAQFGQSRGLIRLVSRVQILLPVPNVLIVQRIEHGPSKSAIQVRSLVGTPLKLENIRYGCLAERSNAGDCKSLTLWLQWFKSISTHHLCRYSIMVEQSHGKAQTQVQFLVSAPLKCPYDGTGRHNSLRNYCPLDVQVQVLLGAP